MSLCFLRPGVGMKVACKRKHKSKVCLRPHSVDQLPTDTIWHGEWPDGEEGDLVEAAKEQRKEHRRAVARWETRQMKLRDKRCAPAFRAYLDELRAAHVKAKPVFVFVPPQR